MVWTSERKKITHAVSQAVPKRILNWPVRHHLGLGIEICRNSHGPEPQGDRMHEEFWIIPSLTLIKIRSKSVFVMRNHTAVGLRCFDLLHFDDLQ